MDRREAIKRVGVLMGGAVSFSTVAGVLGGCQAGPATEPFVAQTLTPGQNDLVATMAECIIPATDTPGAKAARVNEFIDVMLTDWYPADEREHFLQGLAMVDENAQEAHGKTFLALTPEEQTALLLTMDEQAFERRGPQPGSQPPFIRMMKELTVFGYYTSAIGATEELRDMPFGEYRGSVPYSEIGRSWSSP